MTKKELEQKRALLKELDADLTDMEQYGDPHEFPNYENFYNQYEQLKREVQSAENN